MEPLKLDNNQKEAIKRGELIVSQIMSQVKEVKFKMRPFILVGYSSKKGIAVVMEGQRRDVLPIGIDCYQYLEDHDVFQNVTNQKCTFKMVSLNKVAFGFLETPDDKFCFIEDNVQIGNLLLCRSTIFNFEDKLETSLSTKEEIVSRLSEEKITLLEKTTDKGGASAQKIADKEKENTTSVRGTNMKFYISVEEFARGAGTALARRNKAAKLISICEDEDLKVLLLEYHKYTGQNLDRLSDTILLADTPWRKEFYTHTKRNIDKNLPTNRKIMVYLRNVLLDYVKQRKAENKPQWQVVAEKNGWVKP